MGPGSSPTSLLLLVRTRRQCLPDGDRRSTWASFPGRVFWEFDNGPTVLEPGSRRVAGLVLGTVATRPPPRMQPALRLDETGDELETILDKHRFVRRRSAGIWSTLGVDLGRRDEIFASFSQHTREAVRQAGAQGVDVAEEDTPRGWATLAGLDAEMAARTPVRPVDAGPSKRSAAGAPADQVDRARGSPRGRAARCCLLIIYGSTALVLPSSRATRSSPRATSLWEAIRWAKARGCAQFDLGGYSLSRETG